MRLNEILSPKIPKQLSESFAIGDTDGFMEKIQSIPKYMYHCTSSDNRESILQNGLQTKYDRTGDENNIGSIYLCTKLPEQIPGRDIWKVNVSGMDLSEDTYDGEEDNDTWWQAFDDVPTERLELI